MITINSFWKPVKSKQMKAVRNYGMPNLNKYPRRTSQENKLIKTNPYGDRDGDGVMNYFDCRPLDKKQDSKMLRREVAKRVFGAEYYSGLPPEDYQGKKKPIGKILHEKEKQTGKEQIDKHNTRYKEVVYKDNPFIRPGRRAYPKLRKGMYKITTTKDVVKILAKNPDLIKDAEEIEWGYIPYDEAMRDNKAGEYHNPRISPPDDYYDSVEEMNKAKKAKINLSTVVNLKRNIAHDIKHEIAHHKQYRGSTTAKTSEFTDMRLLPKNEKGEVVLGSKGWHELHNEETSKLVAYNSRMAARHKIEQIKRKKAGLSQTSYTPYLKLPWKERPIEIDAQMRARAPHARQYTKILGDKPEALQKLPKMPKPKPTIKVPLEEVYSFSHSDNIVEKKTIHPDEFLKTTYEEYKRNEIARGKPYESYEKYLKGAIFPTNVTGIKKVLTGQKKSKYRIPIPFLEFTEKGEPRGHEGRHTALAYKKLGITEMPVTIVRTKTIEEETAERARERAKYESANIELKRKPFDKIDEELQEKLIQQGGDIRQIRKINNVLARIKKRIVQKENTPTEEYKKIEDVDKSDNKQVQRLEKESQREDKKIMKLEKEARKEKQIMEKENKKAEQAKVAWSKLSEYEKRQVGKVIAKEAEVPEYMHDKFAAEIAKSYS